MVGRKHQRRGRIGAFVIVLLLFGIAHQRAKRVAQALVAHERWAPFPPPGGDSLAQASLQRMSAHVDQLVQKLPTVAVQRPQLHWNDSSVDHLESAGMAFGYRDEQHLCLNEGMHPAFLSAPRTKRFHSVLLHELGHIANRDVSRTTFSLELGRTFTQLVPALATITIGYLLVRLSRRFMGGASDQADLTVLGIITQIAVSAVLITALIELIRASVLRVREYYADAVPGSGWAAPRRLSRCWARGQQRDPSFRPKCPRRRRALWHSPGCLRSDHFGGGYAPI